jgi:hypothetical protein
VTSRQVEVKNLIKTRRMRWEVHTECTWREKVQSRFWWEYLRERKHFKDEGG